MRPTVSVLQLDTHFPRIPGDVGSKASYLGPIEIIRIPQATVRAIVSDRPDRINIVPFEGALRIARGDVIVTSCGFLAYWQVHLQRSTRRPFISSALMALEGRDDNEMGTTAVKKLVETLDEYIPEPERAIDGAFLMPIEDVFSISGRGTVVTGRIETGIIKGGEEISIVGIKDTTKTICTGVEMFRELLDEGRAGDNVGVLLRGTKRDDVERGQVLAKPGSITPHTKFKCECYILTKEEGGRHTPFFSNYRPQFYFRTTDVTGTIELPEGTEMVMPGDNIAMSVNLIAPIAMDEGLRFAIREGGRTVGAGVVASIQE